MLSRVTLERCLEGVPIRRRKAQGHKDPGLVATTPMRRGQQVFGDLGLRDRCLFMVRQFHEVVVLSCLEREKMSEPS